MNQYFFKKIQLLLFVRTPFEADKKKKKLRKEIKSLFKTHIHHLLKKKKKKVETACIIQKKIL